VELFSGFRGKKSPKPLGNVVSTQFNNPLCKDRIKNLKNIGFKPMCIFDCGASVGYWSCETSKTFPGVQLMAIEPNELVVAKTKELLSKIKPMPIIEQCAIGAKDGTAFLNVWDNEETKMSGSSLKDHVQGDPQKKMEVVINRLDTLASKYDLQPDLIKLDLQGYELEALKGASELLKTTEVFIIEFGCLPAYVDRATPNDLLNIMYENDYCLYDIVDLIYRPYDNALTGGDFFFVKNSSNLKCYKGYK
jgi:FkbM family methyltransferase